MGLNLGLASKIPVAPATLRLGHCFQRLAGLDLVGELLDQLLPVGADAAPVAHQAHGPEQILLDHEAVEAPHPMFWVDPVQHQSGA